MPADKKGRKRPIVVDGIGEHAVKGDLINRIIMLRLLLIPEEKREEEEKFWRRFEAARPRILGGLPDAACAALRRLPPIRIDHKPRMADFAVWATAAEVGFGFEDGAFLRAYRLNRAEANQVALESAPLATELLNLLKTKETPWEPTTSDLLEELNARASEDTKKQRCWPRTAKALSNGLESVAPSLRAAGINVERGERESGTGRRIWCFVRRSSQNSQPSHAQAETPAGEGFDPVHAQQFSGLPLGDPHVTAANDGAREFSEDREFENDPYEDVGDEGFEIDI